MHGMNANRPATFPDAPRLRPAPPLALAAIGLLLGGCLGGVAYDQPGGGSLPSRPQPTVRLETLPRPLRVMALPISLQGSKGISPGLQDQLADPQLPEQLLNRLIQELDRRPAAFERVPMPVGPEADEVMRKTMASRRGVLPPAEFAKIKGFKLPDRFVYGNLLLASQEQPQLLGKGSTIYTAELALRLVDGNDLTFIPALGVGRADNLDTAIAKAFAQAVDQLACP